MRRIKIILFIILISGILLFAGCDFFSFGVFKEEDKDSSSVITLAPDNDAQITSTVTEDEPEQGETQAKEDNSGTEQAPTSVAIEPAEIIDLPLYSVNISSGETEPIIATIPKNTEITPELIVDKVVESMADRSLDVGVKSVTSEKDAIIVDFYKDKAPLSENEVAILDAIAMSLIDNLTDYNKVIFKVEGEAYVSGHIELEIDEPYLKR